MSRCNASSLQSCIAVPSAKRGPASRADNSPRTSPRRTSANRILWGSGVDLVIETASSITTYRLRPVSSGLIIISSRRKVYTPCKASITVNSLSDRLENIGTVFSKSKNDIRRERLSCRIQNGNQFQQRVSDCPAANPQTLGRVVARSAGDQIANCEGHVDCSDRPTGFGRLDNESCDSNADMGFKKVLCGHS